MAVRVQIPDSHIISHFRDCEHYYSEKSLVLKLNAFSSNPGFSENGFPGQCLTLDPKGQ